MGKITYLDLNEYLSIIEDILSHEIEDKNEIDEIISELRGHILDKAESYDLSQSEAPTNIRKILRDFGDPTKIAQDYVKIYNEQKMVPNRYEFSNPSYYNMYAQNKKKRTAFKILAIVFFFSVFLIIGLIYLDIIYGIGFNPEEYEEIGVKILPILQENLKMI
ncbi:HAAS signaling domain-containing protein [Candidatus Lokiarchaeum ossiferum]|uniref:HAAS signaling domain-containing protein n=1 Tax=Candidatus Lokiarchaeum ossiferum TaxID=2951803 RepID=UPI00352DFC14